MSMLTFDPEGVRRSTLISLATFSAVIAAYFFIPVESGQSSWRVALSVVITSVAIGVVTWVVVKEFRRQAQGAGPHLTGIQLLVLFELVLVIFALGYYSLAVHGTDQMDGIETRLDALYFTATTMATVGYGDIHPEGQLARAIATAQMAFDIIFVAAFVRLITVGVRVRIEQHQSAKKSTDN
ncbi:potassium channel family protein [Marmoricola sp. RAF53]|uniref:potassium channel family protein n=1 Tax=Marmoricola sp. RAF53 TaxID=3233059 RepID=UPI003F997029